MTWTTWHHDGNNIANHRSIEASSCWLEAGSEGETAENLYIFSTEDTFWRSLDPQTCIWLSKRPQKPNIEGEDGSEDGETKPSWRQAEEKLLSEPPALGLSPKH